MCVAMPGRVELVREGSAVVNFSGSRRAALTGLVRVKPGDAVLVHAGCVLQVLSASEEEELRELMEEMEAVGI